MNCLGFWRSASTIPGTQCVTANSMITLQKLFADSWDILTLVLTPRQTEEMIKLPSCLTSFIVTAEKITSANASSLIISLAPAIKMLL